MEKSLISTHEKVNIYIPDDIVFSILSKLPIKSFKRFECVHKSWSLFFQNHHFINMFRNNFLTNSHRCYYDSQTPLFLSFIENREYDREYVSYSLSGERFQNKVKLDFSNIPNCLTFEIFGFVSINGILCLHSSYYDENIVLWNLADETIKFLPRSTDKSSIPDVTAAFYIHGFGYDDLVDDYMIIGVDEFGDCEPLESVWKMYSLSSNSWKTLDVDIPSYSGYIEGAQVYMDGVCHWLCQEDSPAGQCVVSFYLSNEMFFKTPTPDDDLDFLPSWINLAVLNRSIALFSYQKDTSFHISILGEFGMKESWTKLLIVGPLSCVKHPIAVGTKGEIFFIRKDKELVWFDLSTQMIMELGYKGVTCSKNIVSIRGISN